MFVKKFLVDIYVDPQATLGFNCTNFIFYCTDKDCHRVWSGQSQSIGLDVEKKKKKLLNFFEPPGKKGRGERAGGHNMEYKDEWVVFVLCQR